MDPGIRSLVESRLEADDSANSAWSGLVVAALGGREVLEAELSGGSATPRAVAARTAPVLVGAFLKDVQVEGFRGIGPQQTLSLRPGPGLTLVVGRNGSGKSSFAEGLEVLLTGRNYRWEKRPKVWLEGWRNLHHSRAALAADLIVEGRGNVAVSRTWKSNDLAANQLSCVGPDKKP